ncbi:hypothetical protein Tpau_1911 [Tsukamurella paurometabola DSM 20162]|uniref:Uncharacterized protein n=1 Tax=Tsukamurella paurometabola (strain ATCC 8368 / DSM 20162 / CCUG 35730 / CIP 100753 / JCM 10117 / KCTC 9821 / NBRC 16120 / NCIMB 702349 / NCTC 13040) TaxID=521096 RepID=D5UN27_TSUPD|nr:hypothetical protein Tpau_1911 [Tsukamurella paurometabola DSM 20162]
MDGAVLGDADVASFEVTMADGTRWVYGVTDESSVTPDGSFGVVFACRGRQ